MVSWMLGVTMPLGVAAIVLGVVAFRTGWVIAPWRGYVRSPRVYGVGVVLVGTGLLAAMTIWFAVPADVRWGNAWLGWVGNALEVAGGVVIAASHLRPRHGRAPHAAAH